MISEHEKNEEIEKVKTVMTLPSFPNSVIGVQKKELYCS